jgi:hypothetical protein
MELADMIRQRITTTRHQIEELNTSLAVARLDLKKWEEALAVELKQSGGGYEASYESPAGGLNKLQILSESLHEEALGKTAFVRSKILNHEGPIIVPMLIESLKSSISRSTVYNVINEMKGKGEIHQLEDGRIEAVEKL